MRPIAIAIAGSGALIAFAIVVSERWRIHSFAAGAGTRTVITDAWTGNIQVCTSLNGSTLADLRTVCASDTRP